MSAIFPLSRLSPRALRRVARRLSGIYIQTNLGITPFSSNGFFISFQRFSSAICFVNGATITNESPWANCLRARPNKSLYRSGAIVDKNFSMPSSSSVDRLLAIIFSKVSSKSRMRSLREVARALANFVFPEAAGPLTKKTSCN